MRELEATLARSEDLKALAADLARLAERIRPESVDVARQLAGSPNLASLSQLRAEWDGIESQVDQREDRLQQLVASFETQEEALKQARELWQRTLEFERKRDTPEPILASVRSAADELERGAGSVQKALQEALVLQNEFASLHAMVQGTIDAIEDTRRGMLDNLLSRDDAPLWQVDLFEQLGQASDWGVGRYLGDLRAEGARYLRENPEPVFLHLLLFGLLWWAVRAAHQALRRGEGDAEDAVSPVAGARLATRHPLAAALVLAALCTPLVHEGLPRPISSAIRLAFMLPAVVVLRPLLGEALRAPLYLLAAFFVVDRVREVLTGAVAPGRVLFTVEMLALAGVLGALMHRRRLERFPAALRGNRWLAALGLWIRFSALTAAVAALASVTGYTRLASLLGGGVLSSGYTALIAFAFLRIAEGLAAALFGGHAISPVRMLEHHRALLLRRTGRVLRAFAILSWLLAVTAFFGVREPIFRGLRSVLSAQYGYGSVHVSLGGVLAFVLTLFAAWLIARLVQFVLDEEVFPRLSLARGVPFALATLSRYAILLTGLFMALSALGFDLDRITILLGAFGVGIGFGLQTVVNNFVSGLILLFERPVKVGDVVELSGVEGTVRRIGIRASTVRTYDGADVIVPNGLLLSERVVNWTLSDRMRRLVLPIGVGYASDLGQVMALLQKVAGSVEGVCAYPKPVVVFMGFGESSLDFQLRVWSEDLDAMLDLRSHLGVAVHTALREAGIEIPFPQRDLHVASVTPDAARALRGGAPDRDA